MDDFIDDEMNAGLYGGGTSAFGSSVIPSWKSGNWMIGDSFNWKGLGASMLGVDGGGAGGLNGGLSFGKAIGSGLGMVGSYLKADNMASAYRAQADLAAKDAAFQDRMQSADYLRAGEAAVRNVGIVQRQGMDSATLRYNALNSEIAAQRVGAAGSGIDLSSRTVGKAEKTSRMNAAWDVDRIGRSTKIAADSYNAQAETAFRNSAFAQINGEYQGQMAKIQGDLNAELAEIGGMINMVRGGINMGIYAGAGAFAL